MSKLSNWQELLDSFTKNGFKKGKVNRIHQIKNINADRIKDIFQDKELRYLLTFFVFRVIHMLHYKTYTIKIIEIVEEC